VGIKGLYSDHELFGHICHQWSFVLVTIILFVVCSGLFRLIDRSLESVVNAGMHFDSSNHNMYDGIML